MCVLLFSLFCNKDELLSKEEIASNLAARGKIDSELLVGEWEITRFSFTADGKKISNATDISSISSLPSHDKKVSISAPKQLIDEQFNPDGITLLPLDFYHTTLYYSISGHLMIYKGGYQFATIASITDDGHAICEALKNAYSFSIKDNELIILFIGAKYRNLLILKKQ